jgi:hypothetical protein
MKKLRDDSTWNQLTLEQREQLEGWLFDENLGYAKTLELVREEFGLEATIASLGRYYRRTARERQYKELVLATLTADELNELPVDVASLRKAAIKLVGKAAIKLASEKPNDLDHLVSFTKLLLDSEDNEIRQARLKLAQKYFDYEATAACQKDLPRLRAYLEAISDDTSLSNDEKLKRVHAIMFGWKNAESGTKEAEAPKEPEASKNGN